MYFIFNICKIVPRLYGLPLGEEQQYYLFRKAPRKERFPAFLHQEEEKGVNCCWSFMERVLIKPAKCLSEGIEPHFSMRGPEAEMGETPSHNSALTANLHFISVIPTIYNTFL